MASVVGLVNVILTMWVWPGVKGASHMCRSSLVWLTPSRRLDTTRGSLLYSGSTLISAGSAEIWIIIIKNIILYSQKFPLDKNS